MKHLFSNLFPVCLLILSACSSSSQAPAAGTTSQDPCAPENLPTTVQPINNLMREFDDASELAANLPARELPDVISNLQRIRRDAQDVEVPPCLETLKTHQLNHMNLMIQTLIAFIGGATVETLNEGLQMARQEHELYSLEMVRLLGITLAPITVTPPSSAETPAPTSAP